MKNLIYKFSFLFFLCFFNGALAQLNSKEIAQFKANINSATSQIQSLQSDFVQTKRLDFMDNDIKSTGKLYYKSKSKIRWEYASPFRYFVIFNNNKMFVNDNGKTQQSDLSSSKLLKDLSQIMLGAVNGSTILDESKFKITYVKSGGDFVAKMIPIDKTYKKYIRQIDLTFDGKTYLLKKIKTTEPSLDYTLIEFQNQRINLSVADEKFSFK